MTLAGVWGPARSSLLTNGLHDSGSQLTSVSVESMRVQWFRGHLIRAALAVVLFTLAVAAVVV
jgi:hypothetical protein